MAVSNDMLTQETKSERGSRRSVAFLVESMFVLALLMVFTALFIQLFAGAQLEGRAAHYLSKAVVVATNCAEQFSADPSSTPATSTQGDLEVRCDVETVDHEGGTLHNATITVEHNGEVIYTLHTARYVHTPGGDES